jgi:hypothetical protein
LASRCGKGEHAQWIELYGKDITGRRANHYLCVTGHQFSKTREITDCLASLSWRHQTFKLSATPAITYPVLATRDNSSRLEKNEVLKTQQANEGSQNVKRLKPASALKQQTIATAVNGSDTRAEPEKILKHIATPAKSTMGAAISSVASPDNECHQRTFPFTDLGNAERFVHLYGDQVRYCQQNKSWYIWDGRRWERDQKMQAMGLVHNTVRSILNDATNTRLYKEQAKLTNNHARNP